MQIFCVKLTHIYFIAVSEKVRNFVREGKMAKVFISYSKRDYLRENGKVVPGNVVDRIIKALSANGISYWIDRESLDPGVTYAEHIAKNIKKCDIFLFLATENANTSEWTLREISTAIDFGKTILPVRIDHSPYADSVALYLASVQYIDWQELGERESISRILARVKGTSKNSSARHFEAPKLYGFTKFVLNAGLVFLTGIYACLTYQFLWAKALRSSEIMGGLVGYVCEFVVLVSIYYIIRMLRLRRCTFAIPALTVIVVFLAGMLLGDSDVMLSAILLLIGWLFLLIVSVMGGKQSFFKTMSKEQVLMKINDPENLIFVYLLIKAAIIVSAHYFGLSMHHTLVSPYLF